MTKVRKCVIKVVVVYDGNEGIFKGQHQCGVLRPTNLKIHINRVNLGLKINTNISTPTGT